MGNSGHFDNEISKKALEELAGRTGAGAGVRGRVHLPGRAEGLSHQRGPADEPGRGSGPSGGDHGHELLHPGPWPWSTWSSNHASMRPEVYKIPKELDELVARIKLRTMGVTIDALTKEQMKYLQAGKRAPDEALPLRLRPHQPGLHHVPEASFPELNTSVERAEKRSLLRRHRRPTWPPWPPPWGCPPPWAPTSGRTSPRSSAASWNRKA